MDLNKLKYLESFLTNRRLETFERVLSNRTRYCTVVLEDIYQPNNASAVLRSCDCFGIQDVHIIENRNEYIVDREVSMGSHKWLDLYNYKDNEFNTDIAISQLKSKGYRIIATTPQKHEVLLPDFDINKGKFALFFGTELTGLSETVLKNADENLCIPMYGFTESFNLSVSVAIILQNITQKLHISQTKWQLSDTEKFEIKMAWLRKSIKSVEMIEEEYDKRRKI